MADVFHDLQIIVVDRDRLALAAAVGNLSISLIISPNDVPGLIEALRQAREHALGKLHLPQKPGGKNSEHS